MRQRPHRTTDSNATSNALANARAPDLPSCNKWKAMRWAVFGPTPGKARSASMS